MMNQKQKSGVLSSMAAWFRETAGGIAIYMALMVPVLTGAIGMAIDLSESYLMQERLSRALDAAALAVAGSSSLETQEEMQTRVNEFMEANYPAGKIGSPYNIHVTQSGDYVTVTADAKFDTTFLRFLGFDTIDTGAKSTVQRLVQGIEVALVLDNTGSMSYVPPGASVSNIEALKSASTDFVNIMFSKAAKPEDVRIGLVPFANSVRVGLYGLGMVPDPLTGEPTGTYNGGATFITLPAGKSVGNGSRNDPDNNFYAGMSGTSYNSTTGTYSFTSSGCGSSSNPASSKCTDMNYSNKWYGCVIEHKTGGWDINSDANDPYPNDVTDNYTGPWETYQYSSLRKTRGSCADWHCTSGTKTATGCTNSWAFVCDAYNYTYSQSISSRPNTSCPYANVMPLNSNQSALLEGIGSMQANGNTQGNTGMIWGYRLISPEAPFTEGASWTDTRWKKAVIMMTDGDNTWDNNYSEYWLSKRSTDMDESTLDSRFVDVCNTLKNDRHVLIYTIIFKSETAPTAATQQMYKDCATNPDTMYFYAPTQDDLKATFQQIARELSNLHLSE